VGALLTGVAIPLALHRLAGGEAALTALALAAAVLVALALVHLGNRVQGWRAALIILAVYSLVAAVL
jgi:hypothetical protein